MIKSGELSVPTLLHDEKLFHWFVCSAKYPLAIVNRLLSAYGADSGCAYEIGCTFAKMVENSSMGLHAKVLNLHFMVGSFHGLAHTNHKCQLDWHPMYINGAGHTEGEGCEHVFSMSNELACSTRHGTQFHCHQALEQYFTFWDEDKYATLSMLTLLIIIMQLIQGSRSIYSQPLPRSHSSCPDPDRRTHNPEVPT